MPAPDRIRVMHVCDKFGVGGASVSGVSRLFNWWFPRFDASRFDVRLVGLRKPDGACDEMRRHGIDLVSLGKGKVDPSTLPVLLGMIRQFRPHVLHLHGYGASNFGRAASRLTGTPVVLHEHMGGVSVPAYQRCADAMLARWTDYGIAVSQSVKEFMVRDRFVPQERVRVITNGVPLESFQPCGAAAVAEQRARWGIPEGHAVVSIIGRLSQEKGLDDLLRAASILKRRRLGVTFLIVGDGWLQEELRWRCEQLGLKNHVRFTGHVADVAEVQSITTVQVIASHREGIPLSLMEAMAMSRAIVSTGVGGMAEVLRDGHNALLVPPHAPQALAEAIERLVRQPVLAERLGEQAQRDSRAFDVRRTVEQLQEIYEEIMRKSSVDPLRVARELSVAPSRRQRSDRMSGRIGTGRDTTLHPRVCMYTTDFYPWPGGVSTYTRHLANALAQQDFQITVVTDTSVQVPCRVTDPLDQAVQVVRRPSWRTLAKVIRQSNVVHLHSFHWPTLLLAKAYRKPVVLTHHTHRRVCPAQTAWHGGKLCRSRLLECWRDLASMTTPLLASLRVVSYLAKRWADGFVDAPVVLSAYAHRRLFGTNGRVQEIPYGIPVSGDAPSTREMLQLHVLFVGYLIPEKGCEQLLEAVKRCQDAGYAVKATVCGGGAYGPCKSIHRYSDQLGLNGAVTFTGYLNADQVNDRMREATVLVIPSIAPEIGPLVALEAMAVGCIVIGANFSGIPELIGEAGLVFRWNDVDDLTAKLMQLADDRALQDTLRTLGRQRVREHFGIDRMANDYSQLYRELCDPEADKRMLTAKDEVAA